MLTKDFIGVLLMAAGVISGVLATCVSKRMRDLFFAAMVVLAPMTERVDINFVSRDFYRGTTRGIEISLVDILAISIVVSSILFPRKGERRAFWPASFGLMLLFFLYACANVGMADPMLFGLFELSKMVRGITIFLAAALYIRSAREMNWLIFSLGLIVCYEGALALKERYLDGVHRVSGTLDDSNSLSVFFCTTAPVFVAALTSRIPLLIKFLCTAAIAMAIIGVILTISRAGVIIVAFVLLGCVAMTVSWQITPKKVILTTLIAACATGVVAKSWKTLEARFKESNMDQEYGNNRKLGRGYYIRIARAIANDKTYGVGLNNWSYWVSQKYGPRLGYRFVPYHGTDLEPSRKIPSDSNVDEAQAAPAHSLGALTLGELGVPGLVLFGLLWMRWFQMGVSFLRHKIDDPMYRMGVGFFFALCGIFLQSLTEWVFRHSPIYLTIHILLGALASIYFLRRHANLPEKESLLFRTLAIIGMFRRRNARQKTYYPDPAFAPQAANYLTPGAHSAGSE